MPAARISPRNVSNRLGYLATFLAGAAVAGMAGSWMGIDGRVETNGPDRRSVANTAQPSAVSQFQADADNPALAQVDTRFPPDFACQPRPKESARDEFRRLLRELVQSDSAERSARVSLLLARLRQRGPESVPAILEYLRTGRNLGADGVFGEVALFSGGSHYRDLRTLFFLTLAQIAKEHPEEQSKIAAAGIEQARQLSEVLTLVEPAADDPVTRQLAIAALTRLTNHDSIYGTFYAAVDAMTRLHAEELVPVLDALLEENPFNHYIDSYLGALWAFPAETRAAMSRKLVESPAVREVMRHNPESWHWLDAREPDFRRAMIEDFGAAANVESQVALLHNLSLDRKESSARFHRDTAISRGNPVLADSKDQVRARVVLLDELARFCTTPLLQAEREDARARLIAFLARP